MDDPVLCILLVVFFVISAAYLIDGFIYDIFG